MPLLLQAARRRSRYFLPKRMNQRKVQLLLMKAGKSLLKKAFGKITMSPPEYYEDLGDGVYQVYVKIDGKTVPYVCVDSATGDYHG